MDMKVKKRKKIIITGLTILTIIVVIGHLSYSFKENPLAEPYINLYLHKQGKIVGMELEEYIKGTVAAEMPASFDIEALKAQAVCARTYAIKKLITEASYPEGADLSDDIRTCQAFVSLQKFAPNNPARADLLKRIDAAVESTRGEIMLYEYQPIDALYCSTCGGRTESASAVWGGEIGYLQPVKCGDCQESNHFQEQIKVNNSAINNLVGEKGDTLRIKIVSRTPGGRPKKISINGQEIEASIMRKELDLPSSWMEFEVSKHSTIIRSRGYGHGVGLCQYGADGMASRGKDYHQILGKYYTGITFYRLGY